MARATTKKPNGVAKTAKTADISTFFRKPSSDQSAHQNCNVHGDIKPDINPVSGRTNGSNTSRKGKERALGGDTSADPVVISSDEEGEAKSRPKRQKIVETEWPARQPVAADIPSSPGAGPSRSPSIRSCSPKELRSASKETSEHVRPPFAGLPAFQPPPSWPRIINTAEDLNDDDDDDRIDGDGDNDADSQHPGMFDEDENDTQDPGDDGQVVDDEVSSTEAPPIEQPEEENLAAVSRGGSIDLTMEWDEGNDEGMGMEEPDDYDDPPVPSRKQSGKGARGGKAKQVDKCPVCSTSMKGKKDNVCLQVLRAYLKRH